MPDVLFCPDGRFHAKSSRPNPPARNNREACLIISKQYGKKTDNRQKNMGTEGDGEVEEGGRKR
jgi:hypothetical protein